MDKETEELIKKADEATKDIEISEEEAKARRFLEKYFNREAIRKMRRRAQWKGWWIVAILWILAVFLGGGLQSDIIIAIFALPAFAIIGYMWLRRRERAAKKVPIGICYHCGTAIDLVDRWKCGNCEDLTQRHIFSKCPSCKAIFERFACPSCETTLDV